MLTTAQIIETVSSFCNVSVRDIMTPTRTNEIVEARQICQYIIRLHNPKRNVSKRIGVSDSEIAAHWNQDRCTVIHSCKTVRNLADTDKKYRERLDKILDACKNTPIKTKITMKSPKEYAEELIEKYLESVEDKTGTFLLSKYSAKQCALIAVDEIIKAIDFDWMEVQNLDREHAYYESVITELKNL